jgi:hypothetical protein
MQCENVSKNHKLQLVVIWKAKKRNHSRVPKQSAFLLITTTRNENMDNYGDSWKLVLQAFYSRNPGFPGGDIITTEGNNADRQGLSQSKWQHIDWLLGNGIIIIQS